MEMPPLPQPEKSPKGASAKPTQPPSGADFQALVLKVNELAAKVGVPKLNATITGRIPAWKRWVGGEKEYDGTGVRDVVNSHGIQLDGMKTNLDNHSQALIDLRADVKALQEAPPVRPFP